MMKLLFLFLVAIVTSLTKSNGDELWVYFGTYTRDIGSEGIYAKLNLKTGQLTKASTRR